MLSNSDSTSTHQTRIGVLYHPGRQDSTRLAGRVRQLLIDHRLGSPWEGEANDEAALRQVAPALDLLITLGGDGTIVRAVRSVAAAGVPILGVNLGRLGFLAEVEPENLVGAVEKLAAHDYAIEERMMMSCWVERASETILTAEAINDVVLARGKLSRTVRVSMDVDGHYVMTQTADGVIVSTPTGSTAYCLAAGGPIVAPDVRCLTVTPVAAHLAIAQAIVVPAHRVLNLQLIKASDAMLTVDGQLDLALEPGDIVHHTGSENAAKFVRFGGDGYFYETVLRRLRWPDQGPIP